ncbi:hypothetical protein EP517_21995, partial [Salmonella enterica]|nr:hypothetical protein [Salmonella enterica]
HSLERLRVTGFDIEPNPYIKHEIILMLYTINLVTTGPGKLSKSQQYRVTYNLPALFKVLRLMDIRGPLPHSK